MPIVQLENYEEAKTLHDVVFAASRHPDFGVDTMRVLMLLGGAVVETFLDDPEPGKVMELSFQRMADDLGCEPLEGIVPTSCLPPPHRMDRDTEYGRRIARTSAARLNYDIQDLYELIMSIVHRNIVLWEDGGTPREESFRLYIECVVATLGYEIAAQRLCDVIIETRMIQEGWNNAESIGAIGGLAGKLLAGYMKDLAIPYDKKLEYMEQVSHVMTREAVRYGIPAGTDWRRGIAANDTPARGPVKFVNHIEKDCVNFLSKINIKQTEYQAAACAKAAGRLLAVLCGEEDGQLQPPVGKPLVLSAMTETFKSILQSEG